MKKFKEPDRLPSGAMNEEFGRKVCEILENAALIRRSGMKLPDIKPVKGMGSQGFLTVPNEAIARYIKAEQEITKKADELRKTGFPYSNTPRSP